jgi:hypothetical protein
MRPLLLLLSLLAASSLVAQTPPPPELTAAEKQFQEMLNNVTLAGYYTLGDSPDLHDDHYGVDRVTKVKDDTWNFDARIEFNKKEMRITLPLPVKFAGDTPMISLTNFMVPGFGSFSVRLVFYDGGYAGTWSAGADHKGKMFGKIVKNDGAPAK